MNQNNVRIWRERARYWHDIAERRRHDADAAEQAQQEMMQLHQEIQSLRKRAEDAERRIQEDHVMEDASEHVDDSAERDIEEEEEQGGNDDGAPDTNSSVEVEVEEPNNATREATGDAGVETIRGHRLADHHLLRLMQEYYSSPAMAPQGLRPIGVVGGTVYVLHPPRGRSFFKDPHKYASFTWRAAFDDAEQDILVEDDNTGTSAPLVRDEDDRQCPICLNGYGAGDQVLILPCAAQHRFHAECLERWHEESSLSCPMCREKFMWVLAVEDSQGSEADAQEAGDAAEGDGEGQTDGAV